MEEDTDGGGAAGAEALLAEGPPPAARLAETLVGGGELERLRAGGGTAAEMVRQLGAMLPPADEDIQR